MITKKGVHSGTSILCDESDMLGIWGVCTESAPAPAAGALHGRYHHGMHSLEIYTWRKETMTIV